MHVLGVVGAADTGTTATAVDLGAALRREGHHAAVLDLTGDASALFDIATAGTLADALVGDGSVGAASTTVDLPHGDIDEALAAYATAIGRDPTAFRARGFDVDPGDPEPGKLPLVVGGDRTAIGEASDEALSDARADLAFAYDYLIADAGTLGPAILDLLDGILAVTDTRDDSVTTAEKGIDACTDRGLTVVGAVVNRAGERTDVTALGDRLGTDILAVVPEDGRTPAIEPLAFTAPESPAALAYGRLASSVVDWAERDDDTTEAASDSELEPDTGGGSDADDGGSGLLGRFSSRFR